MEGVFFNNIKIADLGFYINLDRREDRRQIIEEQFNKFNITGVKRFSANEDTDSGPINCAKSHYSILKILAGSNFDSVLIMEDDCKFLDFLIEESHDIFNNINNTKWDLFWLGCRNRRSRKYYENNCYLVSSVSHAHCYIVKKDLAIKLIDTYYGRYNHTSIDELLCLSLYGEKVVSDPNTVDFYNLSQPLDVLETHFISMCYEKCLATQYASYSDLWRLDADYELYIINSFPK
jgi:GR25 family glycosyltransferase involved in LPS biosynthesis